MSMTLDEAKRAALDKCGSHATVTLDLAATLMLNAGEPAMRQLCQIKAALQRDQPWTARLVGN